MSGVNLETLNASRLQYGMKTIATGIKTLSNACDLLFPIEEENSTGTAATTSINSGNTGSSAIMGLLDKLMSALGNLFGGLSTQKTDENKTENKTENNQAGNKDAGTVIDNIADNGDDIVNNANEAKYDGSQNRQLQKKEIEVEAENKNDNPSNMGGGNVTFNTIVNGNNNKVTVTNNYNGAEVKSEEPQKTKKMPVSSDFIKNEETKNGKTTYTLSNGIKVEVPEGTQIGDDSFYIDPDSGEASFSALKGAAITGTKKDDKITLYDCEDTKVDAGKGNDNIEAYRSKGITLNGGAGKDTIKTVSCNNITNNGGAGKDKIENIDCSGKVKNDGGKGGDKIINTVYDVKNKKTNIEADEDANETQQQQQQTNSGTTTGFFGLFAVFTDKFSSLWKSIFGEQ